MAKILFINPIVREEDNPKHIPYGISLLASVAINKGHLVQIYDANAWRKGWDVLEQVCQADDWDVIGIGGLTTTYNYIKQACKIIKEKSPHSYLIAGGGFITSMPTEIMKWIPEIDLGILGEAFVTFPEVLEKIDNKDFNFKETLGVAFRHTNSKVYLTGTRPNIKSLDDLPWPAFDLLPLEIYFKNSQALYSEEEFTSKRRIDLMGSIGCSLICKYCWHLGISGDMVVKPNEEGENDVVFTYGRNIRYHSAKYITKMAKFLHDNHGIDFVSFIDENFMTMNASSKKMWLKELCDEWIAAGLQPTCRRDGVPHDENCKGVHWSGTSHAALHYLEILKDMYKAGCANLVYGLESFDPFILKNLGKGSTRKMNMESVALCLSSGIRPIPNIIIGFPEETFESIKLNIEALIETGIVAKPHFATPYPGSEWYYAYKESILEQYNGDLEAFIKDLGDASKITAIISHNFSPLQLLGFQQMVYLRDLRLLEHAQKHWGEASQKTIPMAGAKKSFNIERTAKLKTPLETQNREL